MTEYLYKELRWGVNKGDRLEGANNIASINYRTTNLSFNKMQTHFNCWCILIKEWNRSRLDKLRNIGRIRYAFLLEEEGSEGKPKDLFGFIKTHCMWTRMEFDAIINSKGVQAITWVSVLSIQQGVEHLRSKKPVTFSINWSRDKGKKSYTGIIIKHNK